METKNKLPRFAELDGIRAIAALAVFTHHFFASRDLMKSSQSYGMNAIAALATFGSLGINVFFVLSGFLITSLLLLDRRNTNFFHNFYWKRALRILPVYFVHLVVAAVIVGHAGGYIVLSLLFVVNFAGPLRVRDVGPAWTLSIEEQFYLIWPQFIRRRRLSTIYYVAFALVALSVSLRVLVPLWHGGWDSRYTIYECDALALGALLSCQWFSPAGRTRGINRLLRILNSNVTLIVVVVVQALLLVYFPYGKFFYQAMMTSTGYLTYRTMRLIVSSGRTPKGLRWLANPALTYIGAISYGLYMYHAYVLLLLDRHFGQINLDHHGATWARFVAALAITLIVCTISRYAMELPIQKLRRFVLRPSRLDPSIPDF